MADLVTKAAAWAEWRNGYPHLLDEAKKAA